MFGVNSWMTQVIWQWISQSWSCERKRTRGTDSWRRLADHRCWRPGTSDTDTFETCFVKIEVNRNSHTKKSNSALSYIASELMNGPQHPDKFRLEPVQTSSVLLSSRIKCLVFYPGTFLGSSPRVRVGWDLAEKYLYKLNRAVRIQHGMA